GRGLPSLPGALGAWPRVPPLTPRRRPDRAPPPEHPRSGQWPCPRRHRGPLGRCGGWAFARIEGCVRWLQADRGSNPSSAALQVGWRTSLWVLLVWRLTSALGVATALKTVCGPEAGAPAKAPGSPRGAAYSCQSPGW